jgi:hypothetical protein
MRWLFWDNHKLTGFMATYRYLRTFTPSPDEHVLKHFYKRLDDFLSILEQHMQKNAFAISKRPTRPDTTSHRAIRQSAPGLGAWRSCRDENRPTTCCLASA